MKKLLIALAEAFSAFSAKLHDLSEESPEYVTSWDVRNIIKEMPNTLDRKDVIEIVQEAIEDGDITTKQECDEILEADDIRDFSHAVCHEIEEYDYSQKIADYVFYKDVASLILAFCEQRGIDTRGIYMQGEVWEIMRYFETRKDKWDEWSQAEVRRIKDRAIREHEALKSVTVVNPPTITLSDGTTAVDITNHKNGDVKI